MVIDTLPQPQLELPKQEIVLTIEDLKNAKNIWIGKDIKITDEALGFALANKIPIHKDALKGIDKDAIIYKYNQSLANAEITKKLEKTIGISIDDLRQIIK